MVAWHKEFAGSCLLYIKSLTYISIPTSILVPPGCHLSDSALVSAALLVIHSALGGLPVTSCNGHPHLGWPGSLVSALSPALAVMRNMLTGTRPSIFGPLHLPKNGV